MRDRRRVHKRQRQKAAKVSKADTVITYPYNSPYYRLRPPKGSLLKDTVIGVSMGVALVVAMYLCFAFIVWVG